MAVLTEGRHAGEHLMWEADTDYCREKVTVVSGAGVLAAGTVLGKITTGGKYQPSPATGSDGSQTAVAVLLYPVDATSADADAVISARLSRLNAKVLTYASSVDDDAKKTAKITQLAAVGLIAR